MAKEDMTDKAEKEYYLRRDERYMAELRLRIAQKRVWDAIDKEKMAFDNFFYFANIEQGINQKMIRRKMKTRKEKG